MAARRPKEEDDATVVLRRPKPASAAPPARRPRRAAWPLVLAGLAVASLAGAGLWFTLGDRAGPPGLAPPSSPLPPATVPAPPSPVAARLATPAEILANRAAELTVFQVSSNSSIVVLDFATLTEQGRMLNRIAALVEKAGLPRDRVLDDAALAAAIAARGETVETFYFGHNYKASDLVRFFSLAAAQGIALNAEERRLVAILAALGIAPPGPDGLPRLAAEAAVVTVPAMQPENPAIGLHFAIDAGVREAILRHELSHGEFFTNRAYNAHVARWWREGLSARERTRLRQFLAEGGYDPEIEEVMMNEAMAYVIHTPDPRFFSPEAAGLDAASVARMREKFLEGLPDTWLHRQAWPGDSRAAGR